MMAPICMTARNMARNESDTSSFKNSSTRIIWPVLDMGSHSVTPSTKPMKSAFSISMSMPSLLYAVYLGWRYMASRSLQRLLEAREPPCAHFVIFKLETPLSYLQF